MNLDSEAEKLLRSLPPDGSFLALDHETEKFFKEETGIQDGEELKRHIIKVQQEAYEVSPGTSADPAHLPGGGNVVFRSQVFPYPCIRAFRFAKLKIAAMTVYPRVLELLKNRPEAIFLDIGCCSKITSRRLP